MQIQDSNHVTSAPPTKTQNVGKIPVREVKPAMPSQAKEVKQPSPEELKASVDMINQEIKKIHINLDLSIDKNTKESVVKITDTSTGDIVMQFPSKEALAVSEAVANKNKGAFLKEKA